MKNLALLLSLFLTIDLTAQQSVDINQAMQISADYISADEVQISWLPKEVSTGYSISYRKDRSAQWTTHPAVLESDVTSFVIENSNPQREAMEVRVNNLGAAPSTGYILTGNEYVVPQLNKNVLLVVEEGLASQMQSELEAYITVLEHELWSVDVLNVDAADSVKQVKSSIKSKYDQEAFEHMLLIGHVPVPYSGNNAIDGHTSGNNHRGAWVCDAYYGDLDGNWTDVSVDNVEATRQANKNIPGDGKFDQNFIPSTMEVAVGRIDFSDLPAFGDREVELTKKYFDKNIAYRSGLVKATRRGLVDNNFGLGEGFGQGAIKSFSGFFPVDSIHYVDYETLKTKDYLWSFGAGGGSYKSASGIINTSQFAADSVQSVFSSLFGSYFGDWDNTDNLLRASIANGSTLVNAWSGRPVWHYHFLAMGATFGEVITMVQNNNGNYFSQFGSRLTHISFIGDPTLKMYYSQAAANLTGAVSDDILSLTWNASADAVDGYNIYQRGEEGGYFLVNESLITSTNFDFSCPSEGDSVVYIVRPVVLEESPSGSYYNEGAGTSVSVDIQLPAVVSSFSITGDGAMELLITNTSQGATEYSWDFGDGSFSTEENPSHTYAAAGEFDIVLVASSACKSDTFQLNYTVLSTFTTDVQGSTTVFPNPTNGAVSVLGLDAPTTYQVYDAIGRKCKFGKLSKDKNMVNLEGLPSGVFYLQIEDGSTFLIIKE